MDLNNKKIIATIDNEIIEMTLSKNRHLFNTVCFEKDHAVETLKLSHNHCLLRINNQIREFHYSEKAGAFTIIAGNKQGSASIEDHFIYSQRQKNEGTIGDKHAKNLLSPMPGLIIEIMVSAGDSVKKGDQLMILEAMKMENIIKAPGDACIKKIHVQKNQSVEKDQLIIEFND